MLGSEDQKHYLSSMLDKINLSVTSGETSLTQIPGKILEDLKDAIDPEFIKSTIVNERVLTRRYTINAAAAMAGISHTLLYQAEKDGRLPPPDFRQDTKKSVRAGYTINQINHIRSVFETAPRKPTDLATAIVGVLNLKGGSHKTTTCHLLSQYLAIRGYRVLVVDTDPQGTLSFYFGKRPDIDVFYEHTIGPFLLEDDHMLVEAGFEEGASESLHYGIQKTYWDNIDIIPACLQNLNIDMLYSRNLADTPEALYQKVMRLRYGLLDIAQDYDFVVVDGTPSLNLTTLNVLSACDMCFVPTPAAMPDYASTLQFANMVTDAITTYSDRGIYPNFPDIRYFITKHTSNSSYVEQMERIIRHVFNVERGDVLTNVAPHSDEIGKATTKSIHSIYEMSPKDSDNRKRLKQTTDMFDKLFSEMHDAIWDTCYV